MNSNFSSHTAGSKKIQWYEERRDQLLKLINETLKRPLSPKATEELRQIQKKCQENQFEIVLVGEFQGGKSTTFNALCDGRDLSPRGLGGGGIKTSAAIISAQNISDGETKDEMEEWAEITYKSKYELQKCLFDLLRGNTDIEALFPKNEREELAIPESFAEKLDLDNPTHRACIQKIIDAKWRQWQSDKSSLQEDEKDLLRIATLILRYYGKSEHQAQIQKTTLGIYDFQKLLAFPKDWTRRWNDGNNARFNFEDVAFVFVARTLLRIKSKSLARLGCRITDCPGLFANAYDTTVAKGAIAASDAIWYLIGGEKQIGEQDMRSLNEIKSMGMAAKITGSANIKSNYSQKLENILPTTRDLLSQSGFEFAVFPYNARMAFLGAQGERILKNEQFSQYELNCMKIDSDCVDGSTTAEMWTEMATQCGSDCRLKEIRTIGDMTEESVAKVRAASQIDQIIDNYGQKIIQQKTQSILIDNGSQRAVAALKEYEGQLKAMEDAATQDEETWRQRVEEGRKALKDFANDSNEIIDDSPISWEQRNLATNLAQELLEASFTRQLALKIAEEIAAARFERDAECYMFREDYNNDVAKDAAPVITAHIKNSICATLVNWRTENGSSTNWAILKRHRNNVLKKVKESFDKYCERISIIDKMDLRLPAKEEINSLLQECTESLFQSSNIQNLIGQNKTWRTFKRGLGGMVRGIGHLIAGDSEAIKNASRRERKAEYIREVSREILDGVEKHYKDKNLQSEMAQGYVEFFTTRIQEYIDKIRNAANDLSERYENEIVKPAEEQHQKSQANKQAIAVERNRIRTQEIEPLRKQVEQFEADVKLGL